MTLHQDLLGGPPPTLLPEDPAPTAELAAGVAPAQVAADHPTKPGNQMALSNVRERLMLLYDMEAELKTSVDHDQFRLVLEFPYRKERRRRDVRRHFSPYS